MFVGTLCEFICALGRESLTKNSRIGRLIYSVGDGIILTNLYDFKRSMTFKFIPSHDVFIHFTVQWSHEQGKAGLLSIVRHKLI